MSRGGLVDNGLVNTVLGFGQMGQQNAQYAAQLALRARLEEMQQAHQAKTLAFQQQQADLANQRYDDQRGAMTSYARSVGGLPDGMTPEQAANLPARQFGDATQPGTNRFQYNAASKAADEEYAKIDAMAAQQRGQGVGQMVGQDPGSLPGGYNAQADGGDWQPGGEAFDRKMRGLMTDSRLAASPMNRIAAKNQLVWTYLLGLPGAAKSDFDPDTQVALRNQLGADSPEWQIYQQQVRATGEPNAVLAHQLLDANLKRKVETADFKGRVSSVATWPDSPIKQQAQQAISGGYATPSLMAKWAAANDEIVKKTQEVQAAAAAKQQAAMDPGALQERADELQAIYPHLTSDRAYMLARREARGLHTDQPEMSITGSTKDEGKKITTNLANADRQFRTAQTALSRVSVLTDPADAERIRSEYSKAKAKLEAAQAAFDGSGLTPSPDQGDDFSVDDPMDNQAVPGKPAGTGPVSGTQGSQPMPSTTRAVTPTGGGAKPSTASVPSRQKASRVQELMPKAIEALGVDARDDEIAAWIQEHLADGK